MAPRIFIFSIVLGAENLSYVKSIETHARAFLTLNILSIGTVYYYFMKKIEFVVLKTIKSLSTTYFLFNFILYATENHNWGQFRIHKFANLLNYVIEWL